MPVQVIKDRNSGKIGTVVLGATAADGGTRAHTITIGGETSLPYLHFEGETPNRSVVAVEIVDMVPDWNQEILSQYGDAVNDPAEWAKKAVELGADLVQIRMSSADPEVKGSTPEECAATVKKVLEAVEVPLIVLGCGIAEVDNKIIPAIAEACAGENLLIGNADNDNYNTIAAACMVHKHTLIANSPLDINICKQLNILVTEMGLPADKIIIDPSIGGLGYGIEYSYSIGERSRIGALGGDKMLSMPVLGQVGAEAWKTKEANVDVSEYPGWGEQAERGIMWETITASALVQSGIDIIVLRHPRSVELVKRNIAEMMEANAV